MNEKRKVRKNQKYFDIFADSRLIPACVYCGEGTENRDHIPAKVFLEKPYPEDMDVLNSCIPCNEGLSLDEEYVACMIEVAKKGTLENQKLRPKIAKTLSYQTKLLEKLKNEIVSYEPFEIKFDENRFHRVLLKLARGHAAHELSEFTHESDNELSFSPIHSLNESQLNSFLELPKVDLYPEIGSRGMQRMYEHRGVTWVEVQENQYYYMAYADKTGSHVRIHLNDYLAVKVCWQ